MNVPEDAVHNLKILLGSSFWEKPRKGGAVAEIVPQGDASANSQTLRFSLGVNEPQNLTVDPGEYTVRLFLPNGDILAESVSVSGASGQTEVDFQLPVARSAQHAADTLFGVAQRLPTMERAEALSSFSEQIEKTISERRSPGPDDAAPPLSDAKLESEVVRLRQAAMDVRATASSIDRISSQHALSRLAGRRWTTGGTPAPGGPPLHLPGGTDRYQPREFDLAMNWIGSSDPEATDLDMVAIDERCARLVTSDQLCAPGFITGERRCYASVVDPTGTAHVAVLPQGWRCASADAIGSMADASILMTVSFDTVMRSESAASERARWRCSPVVDDLEASTYLGFLYNGQAQVADMLLRQAEYYLFEKKQNPIAAAAGAFGLLTYAREDNERERPDWRQWIENLYQIAPRLPDGAIAMAQMYWRYGSHDPSGDDEVDVELLRDYALEAVKRGLPYLSIGITLLSDILLVLNRDDIDSQRLGDRVDATTQAYERVRKINRLVVPGEFFTVLRFEAKSDA
ncbi:hypothetical protein HIV01_012350 [Lysobacter arenosi]|uniref:Sel1 repeat family protein n=1 Tax=Lysobacter arenosi TaxID=2795387 RepID=A0ABX7R906_9GAMM|nr:hypothetical protein [Lysobacter arenosi]QSX74008.1 hypothetical protein HIV01_012350 [Lysobacter arenosi]